MRKAVFYTYFSVFLFSILCMVWLIPAYCPPFSGFGMPPSALPYTLCVIMIIFSIPIMLRTYLGRKSIFRKDSVDEDKRPNPLTLPNWVHLVLFSAVFFATMPLMQLIGFIPGGIVVLVMLQLLCGNLNPVRIAMVSVCTTVIVWLCMTYILAVPMP